jgi:predicted ATPase
MRTPGYERPERMQTRESALREIAKLRAGLGAAGLRKDTKASRYLAKRLASALAYARARGLVAHSNWLNPDADA